MNAIVYTAQVALKLMIVLKQSIVRSEIVNHDLVN